MEKTDIDFYYEVITCSDWEEIGKCKNANNQRPLVMHIPDNCRIMIVSQAPSRSASGKQILADANNITFNQFLSVLDITVDIFDKYVYWTHYGKCYPGSKSGGDQWPTVYCANKFIKVELDVCKKRGLKLVIGVAEPATKYLYSRFVKPDCNKSCLVYSKIRNKKYDANGLTWMFIKHTATTAGWSKDVEDKDFIRNILRPEIRKILCLDNA